MSNPHSFEDPDPIFSPELALTLKKLDDEDNDGDSNMQLETYGKLKNLQGNELSLQKNVTPNILVVSFLEQMCLLYTSCEDEAGKLFEKVLSKMSSVMPVKDVGSDQYKRLREQYRKHLFQLMHQTWHELFKGSPKKPLALESPIHRRPQPLSTSKYLTEFKEVYKISSGGFGSVYAAENIFDKNMYAIKKIPISLIVKDFHKKTKETQKEVEFLSSLNHINIVRYYSSWLEHPDLAVSHSNCDDEATLGESESSGPKITMLSGSANSSFSFTPKTDSSGGSQILFEDEDDSTNTNTGWNSSDCESSTASNITSYSINESALSDDMALISANLSDQQLGNKVVMYIQMKLCESNLHSWLQNRPSISLKTADQNELKQFYKENISMFKQLLSALDYIHNKNIIHRDIKSKNIFLDQGNLLLGDFGLSVKSSKRKSNEFANVNTNGGGDYEEHTRGLGTPLYSAPEQLTTSKYNYKADMYSAGVILLELFWPMETLHEKFETAKLISKKEEFPDDLLSKYPQVCELIAALLSPDPKKRPSSEELLKNDIFQLNNGCKSNKECECSIQVKVLQKEIERLRAENELLKKQIN